MLPVNKILNRINLKYLSFFIFKNYFNHLIFKSIIFFIIDLIFSLLAKLCMYSNSSNFLEYKSATKGSTFKTSSFQKVLKSSSKNSLFFIFLDI